MAKRISDNTEPPEFVKILRPYAELYARYQTRRKVALLEIERHLQQLPQAQRDRIIAAARECTPGNCWWATYEVARWILARLGKGDKKL
ncbi:MAG: hypothetical protein ACPL5F_01510 [Moorellaceae bacterium]